MSKRIVLLSVLVTMVVGLAGISASAIDLSSLMPFLYEGLNYVPLNNTAGILGALTRWDTQRGQAIITYKGEDFVLTPNSSKALYAGRPVALSSPPVVINGVTYVPLETFRKYYNVPTEWDRNRSEVRIKGSSGWRTMKVSSHPPWHGGPPPWAPAWGRRGYGTPRPSIHVSPIGNSKRKVWNKHGYAAPGYPINVKPSGNGKANAWGRRGQDAQGHSNNAKAKGNGKGNAWGQSEHGARGHMSNGKTNGNGKAKGNKKGR